MTINSAPTPEEASEIFTRIRDILESAKNNVARTVNTTQVVSNWLIGREIVEQQQHGDTRAAYGKSLLVTLSSKLRDCFGRGFSVDNLEAFRKFYLEYPTLISVTASRIFPHDGLVLPASELQQEIQRELRYLDSKKSDTSGGQS